MKFIKIKSKGFTMIEVVSTVFILAVGTVGVFGLVLQTFIFTTVTPSRLIAAYLAQEGIEIVRNIRDTNWLEGEAWDTGLLGCQPPANYCEAAYNDISLTTRLSSFSGNILRISGDGSYRFYNYAPGGPASIFRRKITITPDGGALKVVAEVIWQERTRSYSASVQENLYNWR